MSNELTAEKLKKYAEPGELTEAVLNILYSMSYDVLQKILIKEICRLRGFKLLEYTPPEKNCA